MALQSNLLKIADEWDSEMDLGVYETAADVLDVMQQLTPVDTADLQSSERVEPAQGQGNGHYEVIAGGTVGKKRGKVIAYARPVEADQPFAVPATQQINPAYRPAERARRLIRKHSV